MIATILRNSKYIARKKGMLPVYLLLGATWRCNARCVTCFNWKKLNNNVRELSVDEHRRIASNMGPITWLLFTGGEPVLREDLPQVAETYCSINGVERITVPTNALLPGRTEEVARGILDSCKKARIAFSLAIDGVGALHDSIRGVNGNFDKLLDTYNLLARLKKREKRFSINLNTVLMNINIGKIDELMLFVKMKMPEADFHGFEILRGRPPDNSIKPPSADQYREALKKLVPYWAGFPFYRGPLRRVLRAAKIESRLIELETLQGVGPALPCHAGWVSCVIDAEGNLSFCEELDDQIGNLRDSGYDFKKLWFSDKADRLRKFIAGKSCRCTHSCFVGSSMMFEPRYYRRLLMRMIRTYHFCG